MTDRIALTRRVVLAAGAALAAARVPFAHAEGEAADDPWPSLSAQIFDGRALRDGSRIVAIDAPTRAENAALVPLTLRALVEPARLRKLTLVIDKNPSPLAAGVAAGKSGLGTLTTRVRVDSYTNIHAVAELDDGQLYAASRFVKAAGGCSAPAAKAEASSIPPGTMRFRQFAAAPGAARREAQLLIRHPNNSGMQMDQLTRLYVPAFFITSVRIWQGEELLLAAETGISIAENPEFRFDYAPSGAAFFRAEAKDNKGEVFRQEWPAVRA